MSTERDTIAEIIKRELKAADIEASPMVAPWWVSAERAADALLGVFDITPRKKGDELVSDTQIETEKTTDVPACRGSDPMGEDFTHARKPTTAPINTFGSGGYQPLIGSDETRDEVAQAIRNALPRRTAKKAWLDLSEKKKNGWRFAAEQAARVVTLRGLAPNSPDKAAFDAGEPWVGTGRSG